MEGWSAEERRKFVRDSEAQRDALWRPVRASDLWRRLSPSEQELAASTAVTMTERQQVDASWRLEAVQVLMWALGQLETLPPYDTKTAVRAEAPPPGDFGDLVRRARLRPIAEIDRARDVAELWHWRSRTRQLVEEERSFPVNDAMRSEGMISYDAVVRRAASVAAGKGDLPPTIDEDFPAKGQAYRDLTDEEWSEVRSITIERHLTLNWLCGYAPGNRWDDTPTDT